MGEKDGYLPIERLEVFKLFVRCADRCWDAIEEDDHKAWDTFGKQLVRSSDSVCANILEGGHRGSDPDSNRFFVMARGSAAETIYWLRRSTRQKRMPPDLAKSIVDDVRVGIRMLNKLIAHRNKQSKYVKEPMEPTYGIVDHLETIDAWNLDA